VIASGHGQIFCFHPACLWQVESLPHDNPIPSFDMLFFFTLFMANRKLFQHSDSGKISIGQTN